MEKSNDVFDEESSEDSSEDSDEYDRWESLCKLLNFILLRLKVKYLKWNGKKWYPHTFLWTRNIWDHPNRGEWDPDHRCHGFFQHRFTPDGEDSDVTVELPYVRHKVESLDDVVHVFKYSEYGYDLDTYYKDTYYLDSEIKLEYDLHITNGAGELNTDHQGSNHLNIEIDHLYNPTIVIPAGIYTVVELANLVWRIKGNKFDNRFEHFDELEARYYETGTENYADGSKYWNVQWPVSHFNW